MASSTSLWSIVCLVFSIISPSYAQILFDPIAGTCGAGGGTIMSDMTSMANAALGFMNNVQSNAQSSDPKAKWNYYRVATLFDVIFGGADADALTRWNTVQANLQAVADVQNNQPDVYVICDDTKFWTTYPSNGQATQFKNPVDNQLYDYPNGATTCEDPVNGNYLMAYRINVGGTEFIALCPTRYSQPSQLANVNNVEGNVLADPSILSWGGIFFHEIMHALTALNQVGDLAGGGVGGECYQWQDILAIRGANGYSERNPHSTTLFALGLSFEEWFWHSGTAESALSVWNRINVQGNTEVQHFGLLSPPPGAWVN